MKKRSILILLAVTFAVFSPCLSNGFLNWDDPEYITHNPLIRSLSFQNVKKIFSSVQLTSYEPLTTLSFALEYAVFGLSAKMIHLDNILLHLANVLLVYLLIRRLSKQEIIALLTALLFAVHPLRIESVAWAVERKDVLHAAFYLGGLVCYLKARELPSPWPRPMGATFLLFILGCLAKPQAVTFPVAALTLDYFLNRAGCYYSQGEYRKALRDMDYVVRRKPQDAAVYFNRSLIYRKLGQEGRSSIENEK